MIRRRSRWKSRSRSNTPRPGKLAHKNRHRGWERLEPRLLLAVWSGSIPDGTVWSNTEVQHIVGDVRVPAGAKLTIQAGTVVKFDNRASLNIDGTLNAEGTAGQKIYLTSIYDDTVGGDTNGDGGATSPARGQWGRLLFSSTSTADVLDNAVVRYGGSGVDAEVEADGAAPALSNSTFGDSPTFGVRLTGSNATLTGDTFQNNDLPEDNGGVGGAIHIDVSSQPTIENSLFANNFVNGVWVDPGTLPAGTTTWNSPDAVYFVPRTVTVPQGATLNVGAGQVIKLARSLTVQGTLTAEGTVSQPVTFTSYHDDSVGGTTVLDGSTGPTRGDWNQIQFTNTSTDDVLENVVVRYGGDGVNGEVEADGASPTISNSTFTDSPTFGVGMVGSHASLLGDTFLNNDMPEGNGGVGGAIHMDVTSQPTLTGMSFSNNYVNGVWVDPGTMPAGITTWNNPAVVYFVPRTVTVPQGATLSIGAGQIIKLARSITVNGTLKAQGTTAEPVTFTSYHDNSVGGATLQDGSTGPVRGDWNQIQFTNTSTGDTLDHVVVRYGGGGVNGEIEADGASPTISNSTFTDSPTFGVGMVGSNATLTADTFTNNDLPENNGGVGGAIHMDPSSKPTFSGITTTNNYVNGVWIDPGTLSPGTTTWADPGLVYFVVRTVTVPQGATLVIGAGQVVKLARSIIVQGTLKAPGTAAEPVIFTSYHDNSANGTTVEDGSTGPSNGDWNSLEFTSTSSGNVLDHIEARYGTDSSDGTLGMISVTGAALTVSNSVIRNSAHCGVDANTGSSLTLINCQIVNNPQGAGVQGEAGATLNVINCTIDGSYRGVILDSPNATLTNDLITNSVDAGIYQTGPTNLAMTYCDVYNPTSSNYSGLNDQTNSNHNLSVDPKYFNQPGGQYNLRPGSPGEDAGTKAGAPTTDFLGNPRFKDPNVTGRGDGFGYDMGALEVQQTATSNVDLATTAVSGPATGLEDQTVTVNWTVQSVGAGTASGSWHDAVYLSSSPVLTPDAILLGIVVHTGDLGPNQGYGASGTFTLPGVTPGNYYLLVRANSSNEVFEGANLVNNVASSTATVAMDLPAITLGTPTTGSLATTGASELYKVTATAGGNLNLALTGGAGNTNELYVAFGDVPTRESFLAGGARPGSANQSVSIASTQAGTYYVLVYGASVPSGESFSITANTTGFSLASVTPTKGSNTGQVTLSIEGAQFDGNSQPQLVDSAGATIKPLNVFYADTGLISVTFDLTGLPTGPADVQVVNTGNVLRTLSHAFNIIAGQPGRLVTSVSAPSALRQGREFTVEVNYANEGDTDLLAPIMNLSGSNADTFSFASDLSTPETSLDLVGVNQDGPAGILPPGAHATITIYGSATTSGTDNLQLSVGQYGPTPIDWTDIKSLIRPNPTYVTDAEWNPLFAQIQQDIGPTWDGYQRVISQAATSLPLHQGSDSSRVVFGLEVEHAQAAVTPSVSGKLFLNDTTHPLAAVTIALSQAGGDSVYDTVSLNDGSFVIPNVSPGTYNVTFDGFITASPGQVTIGASSVHNVTFVLSPGGTISGSVALAGSGAAVPRESVSITGALGTSFAAATDDSGRYTISSLPSDTYTVTVGGDSYTMSSLSGVTVAAGSVVPHVNLQVQLAGTISGIISGPQGPVSGATVSAMAADGSRSSATTDASGAYIITGLPADQYSVDAFALGLVEQTRSGITLAAAGAQTGVNLTLAQAGSAAGTVTEKANGATVSSAVVTLTGPTGTFSGDTDANGNYNLTEVAPGAYTVTVAANGSMTTTTNVVVAAGATAILDLSLAIGGQVTGAVSNASGAPVADVIVRAEGADGQFITTLTDASGVYDLQGLDAGTYQVIVGDVGTPGVARLQITLSTSAPTATAAFTLPVAGVVSGTVFNLNGTTPLAGADVVLVQNGGIVAEMRTDPQGKYTFDVLQSGAYQIEASSAGLFFPTLTSVSVGGGTVQNSLNFVPGQLTVSGVVTEAATGKPVAGAEVSIEQSDSTLALLGESVAITDADGEFHFTSVAPGMYSIVGSAEGDGFLAQSLTVASGTSPAVSLALPAAVTMQGTVRDAATGAPLAQATVIVDSLTGGQASFTTTTDESGNYAFNGLSGGAYQLAVSAAGYMNAFPPVLTVASATQVYDIGLDAQVSGIMVQGTVSGASGPLSGATVDVIDANGAVVAETTSDSTGHYQLTTLSPGSFQVIAAELGYSALAPVSLTVSPGQQVGGFNFVLSAVALSDAVTLVPPNSLDSIGKENLLQPPPSVTGTDFDKQFIDALSRDYQRLVDCALEVADYKDARNVVQGQLNNLYAKWQDQIKPGAEAFPTDAKSASDQIQKLQKSVSTWVSGLKGLASTFDVPGLSSGLDIVVGDLSTITTNFNQFQATYFQTGDVSAARAPLGAALKQVSDVESNLALFGAVLALAVGQQDTDFLPGLGGLADLVTPELVALLRNAIDGAITAAGDKAYEVTYLAVLKPDKSNVIAAVLVADFAKCTAEGVARDQIDSQRKTILDLVQQASTLEKSLTGMQDTVNAFHDYLNALAQYKQAVDIFHDALQTLETDCPDCGGSSISPLAAVTTAGQGGPLDLPDASPAPPASTSFLHMSSCTYPGNVGEVGGAPPAPQPGSPTPPPPPPTDPPSSTSGGATSVSVAGAYDPNNLVGPAGYGNRGYIQPSTFSYEVDFENDPTKATAAAQIVRANITLDSHLDPTSFQFTSFGFGSHTFIVPAGLSHFSTTIDLRPDGVDLIVPITLDENPVTGAVSVEFRSLDPATMLPPDGINAGFLPVDDAAHNGEGFFTYTVQPKTGLPTGTTISEQASIVFDTNAAISTPTATNTLDVGGPTSSVATLPGSSPTSFMVSWSGSDDANGSGIAFYDVFVSDNGGPFTAFKTATTTNSATFTGTVGHTYGFYSVATDNVAHRQTTPTAAQATTTVSVITFLPTSSVAALPATESSVSFTLSWSGSDAGGPGITGYDVFVSDNGGPFTAFQTDTAAISAMFTGVNGHTYGFFSVAIDMAGNRQPTPMDAQATTTVNVRPPAPTAIPDTFVLGPTGPYSGAGATSVLANDTSADGQPQMLSAKVLSQPSNGTLSLHTDGSFTYSPGASFQGIDRFTYQVSEGTSAGNAVTVTLLSYNASLVDKLYEQVLHRPAEDGGLAYWTRQLDQGFPLDVVATGIFNSTERLNPLVTQFYQQYLGRNTDPGGLAYWVTDWQTKGDPRDVVENILASQEFFDDAGDANEGFINLLYQRVLMRTAELDGLNYWIGQMSPPANDTRLQIASRFYDTHEKHVDLVDFLFGGYFQGVQPLPPTAPYVTDLDNGETETQVEKAIIDSPAYSNNPPQPIAGSVGRSLYPH